MTLTTLNTLGDPPLLMASLAAACWHCRAEHDLGYFIDGDRCWCIFRDGKCREVGR